MSKWVRALGGIAFGGALLWFAIARTDMASAKAAFLDAAPEFLAVAVGVYWIDIALRIWRWRLLLRPIKPLSYGNVSRALIVGYAVNNVLPARLGELFRADFVSRQYGITRTAAFGSIIIERMLDALAVVVILAAGLALVHLQTDQNFFVSVALTGLVGLLFAIAGVFAVLRYHARLPLGRLPWLKERIGVLAGAFAVIRGRQFLFVLMLTLVIWAVESVTFLLVVAACGIELDIGALGVLVGAASLSTLLPSAPGYVGSFQIAFVLTFGALAQDTAAGVAAATLMQIFLLGSLTVIGLGLLAGGSVRKALRRAGDTT